MTATAKKPGTKRTKTKPETAPGNEEHVVQPQTDTPEPKPGKDKQEKAKKGPGVIASIVDFVSHATSDKPITKEELLAKLVKRFGAERKDSMAKTINCQLPSRLRSERKLNVQKTEDGYYVKK